MAISYKMDRTAFTAQTFEEEQKTKTFANATDEERLRVVMYLNSIAYNFDINNPPMVDRTVFSMRKLGEDG